MKKELREQVLEDSNSVKGKCYFCKKKVDGMFFCFGCNKFVCEECDETMVGGPHTVKEHKEV